MANSKPKITLSAAITLDGKIGQKNKQIVLSSKADTIRVHKLRSKSDAILVRKNTVEQDDPLLTCLLYTSPSPRDKRQSRMPSSA